MKPPSGNPLGLNFGYRIGAGILMPILNVLTKRNWLNTEKIPKSGAAVFYSNHVSYMDALVLAHYLFKNGRAPRFIGKEAVFKIPVVGWVLYKAEQIPVKRESNSAAVALAEAIAALKMGHAIGIYPEGTLTRDPNLWPMEGKTGAARIALATKLPVIPVAHWGAHLVLAPYSKKLKLFPRKTMQVSAGKPVDLTEFYDKEMTGELLKLATSKIMDAITIELAKLRNETPPAQRLPWTKERP